jgi:hypothetical protein
MPDLKIAVSIVDDDGADGFFWRNGEKWLRERGAEFRLLTIAPHLERDAMDAISARPMTDVTVQAMIKSRDANQAQARPAATGE